MSKKDKGNEKTVPETEIAPDTQAEAGAAQADQSSSVSTDMPSPTEGENAGGAGLRASTGRGSSGNAENDEPDAGPDAVTPEPECDIYNDPLMTFDDVMDTAELLLMAAFKDFADLKPHHPIMVLNSPEKGERNPARVLAQFYRDNPDAPLAAGFQQLRLKGFGPLTNAETSRGVILQFTVFRAVIDASLAFMKAERAEVEAQKSDSQPQQFWPGEKTNQREPGPFEPSGFTPR